MSAREASNRMSLLASKATRIAASGTCHDFTVTSIIFSRSSTVVRKDQEEATKFEKETVPGHTYATGSIIKGTSPETNELEGKPNQ